jgi:putative oxygen-independent coproporphyrinogen III oxidase
MMRPLATSIPNLRPPSGSMALSASPLLLPASSPGHDSIGIYIHFPWCLSKCPYCDFVAFAAPRSAIDAGAYTEAVLAELAARRTALDGRRAASIFFGGGTPSLWGAGEVRRLIDAVACAFAAETPSEVSLECDPSSLDEDLARSLVDAGVNRLSIGVQALDDERLRFLGRIHTASEAVAAVRAAVRAGVPRVSTDLMYAVAGQTPTEAAHEASALADLGATHVSAYSLTIETDTPFGKLARRGRLPLCEDAVMAESFFAIDDALGRAGFVHYEVSNYAKPGYEARHNLGYWQGRDYLGLGCGAYGTLRSDAGGAHRYRNHATPRAYLRYAASGYQGVAASDEQLDGATLLRERIMLGLRTKDGVDIEDAAARLGTEPYPGDRRESIARLAARGRITQQGSRITVPHAAWIWVDDTAAALF